MTPSQSKRPAGRSVARMNRASLHSVECLFRGPGFDPVVKRDCNYDDKPCAEDSSQCSFLIHRCAYSLRPTSVLDKIWRRFIAALLLSQSTRLVTCCNGASPYAKSRADKIAGIDLKLSLVREPLDHAFRDRLSSVVLYKVAGVRERDEREVPFHPFPRAVQSGREQCLVLQAMEHEYWAFYLWKLLRRVIRLTRIICLIVIEHCLDRGTAERFDILLARVGIDHPGGK